MNQLDDLLYTTSAPGPIDSETLFGEVVGINPLSIILDGDDEPMDIEPSSTALGVMVGDRVRMSKDDGEVIVVGVVDGPDWIEVFDEAVTDAVEAANTAALAANGKNRVFWGTAAEIPTDIEWISGDIWFDSANGNQPHIHDGSSWAPSQWGDAAIGNLNVSKLVGDQIAGNFIVAGSFTTQSEMGGRVEIDPQGIRNYDGADQLATSLNTDGTSVFRGAVEASAVEVLGKLKFHGSDSEIAAGARLNITGGVTPPSTNPSIYPEWLTITLAGIPKANITGVTRDPASGEWIVSSADLTGTPTVTRHNATTGALVATVGTFPAIANGTYPSGGGLAYADGTYWAPRYIKTVESFKNYGVFQIVALTGSARTLTPKTEMGFAYFDDFATIGSTGNTGQIAIRLKDHARSTDIRRLVLYTTSTSTRTVDVAEPTGEGGFWYSGAVAHGNFDFGEARFGMVAPAATAKFHNPTNGAEDTPRSFGTGRSNIAQGFGYYGGSIWSSDSGKCYIYDGPNETDVEFAATWYDSNSGGAGVHETPLGPSGWSPTGIKRARLRVHPPILIPTPGDDGVNAVRLYARISGTMRLQGTLTTPGESLLITGALATSPTHGSVPGFPADSPGSIENATGDIILPGNGVAQLRTINIPKDLGGETIGDLPAGLYLPTDTGLITTGRGYPVASVMGYLESIGFATGLSEMQRYTTLETTPRVFVRSRVGGSWSAWSAVGSDSGATPHGARAGAATQALTTATSTKVTLLTASQGLQGGVTWSNNEFTLSKAGIYLVHARVVWQSNATGSRTIYIRKNSTTVAGVSNPAGSGLFGQSLTLPISCVAGDRIWLEAYQNSGANLNLVSNAGNCGLTVTYMGS